MPFISISNILIWISFLITFISLFWNEIFLFGMNTVFLSNQMYFPFIWQFFLYSFIHWWFLHLFFNTIFLYYFWNNVEKIMRKKKYIFFFLANTIFVWICLLIFSQGNSIGISGFCMALLTYYTLDLKEKNNPEYKWWITAIILNIAIGLNPQISLAGHLSGAIFWWLFWWGEKLLKRK